MNVFGFISIIVICLTIIAVTFLLCRYGIIIHRTYKDLTETPEQPERATMGFTPATTPEGNKEVKELPENPVAIASMDAVIKAANELMGIETVTKETEDGRKE